MDHRAVIAWERITREGEEAAGRRHGVPEYPRLIPIALAYLPSTLSSISSRFFFPAVFVPFGLREGTQDDIDMETITTNLRGRLETLLPVQNTPSVISTLPSCRANAPRRKCTMPRPRRRALWRHRRC